MSNVVGLDGKPVSDVTGEVDEVTALLNQHTIEMLETVLAEAKKGHIAGGCFIGVRQNGVDTIVAMTSVPLGPLRCIVTQMDMLKLDLVIAMKSLQSCVPTGSSAEPSDEASDEEQPMAPAKDEGTLPEVNA
jgi:hypothetical protein